MSACRPAGPVGPLVPVRPVNDANGHDFAQYEILEFEHVWAEDTDLECWKGARLVATVFAAIGLSISLGMIVFTITILYTGKRWPVEKARILAQTRILLPWLSETSIGSLLGVSHYRSKNALGCHWGVGTSQRNVQCTDRPPRNRNLHIDRTPRDHSAIERYRLQSQFPDLRWNRTEVL